MKAIFDTKPSSGYDDEISSRYHFPARYFKLVEQCIGDWIILRRPRADGGNLAYFATARVASIEPDANRPGHSYARLTHFLAFDVPVSWNANGRYAERALRDIPRQQVGVFLRGQSVRLLDDNDFIEIVKTGMSDALDTAHDNTSSEFSMENSGNLFPAHEPITDHARRIERVLTNRVFREASFARKVYAAYLHSCAVTGLRITDLNGVCEVQAAHIWPVASGGPDVIQNGLALTATAHWLFDRHLISLTDDHRLLVAERYIPQQYTALLVGHGNKIRLPTAEDNHPHPHYIRRHREIFLNKHRNFNQ